MCKELGAVHDGLATEQLMHSKVVSTCHPSMNKYLQVAMYAHQASLRVLLRLSSSVTWNGL